jgi:hypothetical protein
VTGMAEFYARQRLPGHLRCLAELPHKRRKPFNLVQKNVGWDANNLKNLQEILIFGHGPIWPSYAEALSSAAFPLSITILTSLLWAALFCGLTACIYTSVVTFKLECRNNS